jgi:hypothetical protein
MSSTKTVSSASPIAQSHKSNISLNTKSAKATATRNDESVSKTSIDQLKPAKRTRRDRIPPPQKERILQEYAAGKSITDIGKQENRNRETVAKIVHGPEMQEFVREMREQWYGLGPDAIGAVRHSLRAQRDGRLGFQVLASIGAIPSPEERQSVIAAFAEPLSDKEARVHEWVRRLTVMAIETATTFGIRDTIFNANLAKVGCRINYETGELEPLTAGDSSSASGKDISAEPSRVVE